MRRLEFPTEQEFLKELDGEVYAISDNKGKFVCDILEEDYLKLRENGELINLDTSCPKKLQGVKSFSQYVLYDDYTDVMLARFKEQYGVEIVITSKQYNRENVDLDDEKMWDKFTYFFRVEKCHNDWTDEQIDLARNDDDLDEFIEWLNNND